MKMFVDGLARMSGLRDRDALDFALVRLVTDCAEGCLDSTLLVRVVGDGDEQRCLTRALLDAQHTTPLHDVAWTNWDALPKLNDFPERKKALAQSKVVYFGASPCTTVFPIGGDQGAWALLELESKQALSQTVYDLVQGIVQTYQNLYGLLDYGEKDALTELLNRKTFDGAFFKATAVQEDALDEDHPDRRAFRPNSSYWLAILDIDHFKRVNDNFGHLIGDEVLLLMARLMRNNFRFHDQLYRFGGEEFVILMRCESANDANVALERLRSSVETYVFPQVGTITVSIGCSVLTENDTPSGAFGRADKAVYYAKGNGRNQVRSYQELVLSGELVEMVSEAMDVDLF
jgi:diguanylate cyclase (GGDEF)-like protein